MLWPCTAAKLWLSMAVCPKAQSTGAMSDALADPEDPVLLTKETSVQLCSAPALGLKSATKPDQTSRPQARSTLS